MTAGERVLLAGVGAALARALTVAGISRWPERSNYRGRPVSLVAGPALAVAASASAWAGAPGTTLGRSALVLGVAAGAAGAYDDVAGQRPGQRADKGIRGHLAALRAGRLSAGAVKTVGIGVTSLLASHSVATRPVDRWVAGGVIAGTANLVNLLDLRPGRALKVALLLGLPLLPAPAGAIMAGPLGATAAVLPADLAERTMLGDAGANAIGALLGLGITANAGRGRTKALLTVIVALTAVSERISFTAVIERTPLLHRLDLLGRRAAGR